MKGLIVGLGNMGSRHLQSLLNSGKYSKIFVSELSDENFEKGLNKIGADDKDVTRVSSFDIIDESLDIAILATSAEPRFEIMKKLILKYGIKRFLLEKIVFQSLNQFDEIIKLMKEYSVIGYCNFVNRYFPGYLKLKNKISDLPLDISMSVVGDDVGIACNAIHYLDLFEFIIGNKITSCSSILNLWTKPNKRGKSYIDFSGSFSANDLRRNSININFDSANKRGVSIIINVGYEKYMINEESQKICFIKNRNIIFHNDFPIIYSSNLTSHIVDDIISSTCLLTDIAGTRNVHSYLFKEINKELLLPNLNSTITPIT